MFYGLDFSGATDAGRKLWLAALTPDHELLSCLPGEELPGSGRQRERCLAALVDFITTHPGDVFGCDFPFALPASLMGSQSWLDFAHGFDFPTPDAFRDACRERTAGKEPKRRTDALARVPFGGFNLRVYRQTFHGLRDLLSPLLKADAARVLPMQEPSPGRATVLEICPASTLQAEALYREAGKHRSYKSAETAPVRAALLQSLRERFGLRVPPALAQRIIADPGGDALDAVIAACATARAVERGLPIDPTSAELAWQEGFIYV